MNRFEQLRYERGLTQREVAKGAGIGRSTVIRLERGEHRPSASTVQAFATFLGVSVESLLNEPEREAA